MYHQAHHRQIKILVHRSIFHVYVAAYAFNSDRRVHTLAVLLHYSRLDSHEITRFNNITFAYIYITYYCHMQMSPLSGIVQ